MQSDLPQSLAEEDLAREIKNLLNFVNNISKLSAEMMGELAEMLDSHPLPGNFSGSRRRHRRQAFGR